MTKGLALFLFFLLFTAAGLQAQQAYEEVVYLKDGSIIRGTIIEQVPNISVKIRTRDGNVFVYPMNDILKITKELPLRSKPEPTGYRYRSPGLAFLFSFLFPGIGQYYNGSVAKGIIQEALYLTGMSFMIFLTYQYREYEYYDYGWGGYNYYYEDYEELSTWFYVGLSLSSAAWIWSMIDAPTTAAALNRRNARKFGHLMEINAGRRVVGFDLGGTKRGLGASLTLHF
jgi:TM2 domain-containing membrane protein YozV